MAKRYSGSLTINVVYVDGTYQMRDHYKVSVSGHGHRWGGVIYPAPAGFGRGVAYDSAKAYTDIARSALAFASDEDGDVGDVADFNEQGFVVSTRKPKRR